MFILDTGIVQTQHHTLLEIECNLKPSVSFCSSNSNSVFFFVNVCCWNSWRWTCIREDYLTISLPLRDTMGNHWDFLSVPLFTEHFMIHYSTWRLALCSLSNCLECYPNCTCIQRFFLWLRSSQSHECAAVCPSTREEFLSWCFQLEVIKTKTVRNLYRNVISVFLSETLRSVVAEPRSFVKAFLSGCAIFR